MSWFDSTDIRSLVASASSVLNCGWFGGIIFSCVLTNGNSVDYLCWIWLWMSWEICLSTVAMAEDALSMNDALILYWRIEENDQVIESRRALVSDFSRRMSWAISWMCMFIFFCICLIWLWWLAIVVLSCCLICWKFAEFSWSIKVRIVWRECSWNK